MSLFPPTHRPRKRPTDEEVAAIGRFDGASDPPIPDPLAATPPPYIEELIARCTSEVWQKAKDWIAAEKNLKTIWTTACNVVSRLTEEARQSGANLLRAEATYLAEHGHAAPATDLRFVMYRIGMVLIGIAEMPLSIAVYRIMGDSEVLVWCMAAIIAAILLGIAHQAGKLLRRGKPVACACYIGISICISAGIAWFRSVYLAQPRPWDHATLPQGPTLLAFFAFSIGLLALAMAMSYWVENEPLANVFNLRSEARRANEELAQAEDAKAAAYAHGQQEYRRFVAEVQQIIAEYQGLSMAYAKANLAVRKDRHTFTAYPAWTVTKAMIETPEPLRAFTWSADTDPDDGRYPDFRPLELEP